MNVRRLLLSLIASFALLVAATPADATPQHGSLVGTWTRVNHCQDGVRALRAEGFDDAALEFAAGNGFIPGVTSVDELADPAHPCRGAIPRRHSHFFTSDGQFGSLDWNGNQVDEGTYKIINHRTFVMPYGFEKGPSIKVRFHYRIHGKTLAFAPVLPCHCSTDRCREAAAWSITVALPGKNWRRVGD